MVRIGDILYALLEKDRDLVHLREELKLDPMELAIDVSLLLALQYIEYVNGSKLRLSVSVFIWRDYEVLTSIARELLREIARAFRIKNGYN